MKHRIWPVFCIFVALTSCSNSGSRAAYTITSEPITLTYWVPLWYYEQDLESAADLPLYQELERITGVTIEFDHPPYYDAAGPFATMVASGDLPDIIEADWRWEPFGAPDIAVSDGIIAPLEKGLQGYAPNLMRILESNPSLARYATDDRGRVYGFPGILPDGITRLEMGPLFRADWLDDLDITVPTTIAEWERTLEAMKGYGQKGPFSGYGAPFVIPLMREALSDGFSIEFLERSNLFAGAYGSSFGFLMGPRGLEYGPVLPEYRDMLVTLNRWFKQGLINDYIADPFLPQFPFQELLASGAWVGPINEIWRLQPIKYIAAPYPKVETSVGITTGPYLRTPIDLGTTAAVSTTSAHLVDAIRWLDFAYGERGGDLMNFGILGTSYKTRGGPPEFTEDLTLNLAQAIDSGRIWEAEIGKFTRGIFGGPYLYSNRLQEIITETITPGSVETVISWSEMAVEDPESILSLYAKFDEVFEQVYEPIRNYRNKMLISFIIGETPIDLFDEYVHELERLGLQKCLVILEKCWAGHLSKPLPWSG